MGFRMIVLLAVASIGLLFLTFGCSSIERKLLFFPTHRGDDGELADWTIGRVRIGCSRLVDSPKNVWLMLHGNGGQAIDRAYALSCFSDDDSVYVMEYPGYGDRVGVPSEKTFNQAAREAYESLRIDYPNIPVCVIGESIGSGSASFLATLDNPPDKVVLVVPFERLSLVAKELFPGFLVSLVLSSDWDNAKALSGYRGGLDIFGAELDEIISVKHAKALAEKIPTATFHLIEGGHNEWASEGRVAIRNP